MEIKDRIVKIMTSEGISSSAFADMIGVQRSSISHILSGRNNPGLEILQKILTGFPKYNADWLITGKGEIYKKPMQTNLFDAINESTAKASQTPDKLEVESVVDAREKAAILPEKPEVSEKKVPIQTVVQDINGREIEKIVIFYKDNTFAQYSPR